MIVIKNTLVNEMDISAFEYNTNKRLLSKKIYSDTELDDLMNTYVPDAKVILCSTLTESNKITEYIMFDNGVYMTVGTSFVFEDIDDIKQTGGFIFNYKKSSDNVLIDTIDFDSGYLLEHTTIISAITAELFSNNLIDKITDAGKFEDLISNSDLKDYCSDPELSDKVQLEAPFNTLHFNQEKLKAFINDNAKNDETLCRICLSDFGHFVD